MRVLSPLDKTPDNWHHGQQSEHSQGCGNHAVHRNRWTSVRIV